MKQVSCLPAIQLIIQAFYGHVITQEIRINVFTGVSVVRKVVFFVRERLLLYILLNQVALFGSEHGTWFYKAFFRCAGKHVRLFLTRRICKWNMFPPFLKQTKVPCVLFFAPVGELKLMRGARLSSCRSGDLKRRGTLARKATGRTRKPGMEKWQKKRGRNLCVWWRDPSRMRFLYP